MLSKNILTTRFEFLNLFLFMPKVIFRSILFVFFAGLLFGATENAEAVIYHVAQDGSKDFIKIQDAANAAQPGDTIIVHAGTYRERVTPPRGGTSETLRITYMAAPGETVYIKGSNIWNPAWLKTGYVHYAKPADSMFNDDVYVDDKNPFKVKMVDTPSLSLGQVFVDGVEYKESPASTVTNMEKTWRYDAVAGNIYIHFPAANPAGHVVEITTRRSIFRPHIKGLQYITVKGFIMEHCGNNAQFGRHVTPASVRVHHAALDTRGGRYWIIENNTVRYARSEGIDAGGYTYDSDNERGPVGTANASYNIIRNNTVMYNGLLGIGVSMHHLFTAGVVPGRGVEITGNWVEGNDYLGIDVAEFGGIKTHYFNDSIIANNVIINQGRVGIWMDQGWENNRVTGNIFFGNGKSYSMPAAIYMEGYNTPFGRETVIDDNLMFDGLKLLDAQGLIVAQNYIKEVTVFYGQTGASRCIPTVNMSALDLSNCKLCNDYIAQGLASKVYADPELKQLLATIGRLTIKNNLFNVSAFDTNPNDATRDPMGGLTNNITIDGVSYPNKITNNAMGVSSFTRSLSGKTITGTLTVNSAPFSDVAPLPSNKITNDYFGKAYGTPLIKGPLQSLINGANNYTLWPKSNVPSSVSTPIFSPVADTYTSAQNVTIATATTGATIYYTSDGTDPASSSTKAVYASAIPISSTKTIKAKAFKTGITPSVTSQAAYTINLTTVATPAFSPAGETYSSAQNVTISTATTGATIRYTTDGTAPTTTSPIYSTPIAVSSTTTLKAGAWKTGMTASSIASASYTINTSSANFAPNPGFESDPSVNYAYYGTGTFTWASDYFHTGVKSLKIVSSQAQGQYARWIGKTDSISATAGQNYTAAAWMKSSGVTQYGELVINFWDANKVYLNKNYISNLISGTSNWTKLTVSGIAPANTKYIRAEFRLYGPGTIWIDDVELK